MRRQGQESRAWRLADGGSSGRTQRTQRRRALSWEDQSGDFSDAIPGKRRYCPGPILGPCAPGFFHPPGRFSRPGGGQSKKSPTVGNVPQARDPASGGDFASRRRAAAYVLHAYTVAALHGTVAARSVARPRCRMGLQLSSGFENRRAPTLVAGPPSRSRVSRNHRDHLRICHAAKVSVPRVRDCCHGACGPKAPFHTSRPIRDRGGQIEKWRSGAVGRTACGERPGVARSCFV